MSWDSRSGVACSPVQDHSRNGRVLPVAYLPAFAREQWSPAIVAAAKATEPIPSTLLLEIRSCTILPFFSLTAFFLMHGEFDHIRACIQEQQEQINLTCLQLIEHGFAGCDARLISSSAKKTR